MDKINNKKIKKPKRISKTLGVLKGIKTHESCLYERFNNAKIVDIEDSTRYQMDNSFHETHERVMAYKDNLNEEEMLDPDTEKQNYYNGTYWSSNGISQRIGENEYFYDYDTKNNEIILKYFRKGNEDDMSYVEDLNSQEKNDIKEILFYGEKRGVNLWEGAIVNKPNEVSDLLEIVHSDYEGFKFLGKKYYVRWDLDQYLVNDPQGDVHEFKSNDKVIDYLKEIDGEQELINGYTKKDIIDFLNSHPQVEDIYLELKDMGIDDIEDMQEVQLCNFAEKWGMEDGDEETDSEEGDLKSYFNPGEEIGYHGRQGEIRRLDKDSAQVYFPDVDEIEEIDGEELLEQEGYINN